MVTMYMYLLIKTSLLQILLDFFFMIEAYMHIYITFNIHVYLS